MNAPSMKSRARGVMYGQVIGDSLGSQVEFTSAPDIASLYPGGVRELADGGPFNLSAGQPTDDSEMALALARSLIGCGGFNAACVRASYTRWASTKPADIGITCSRALLHGQFNEASEANGALMRISPLAIRYAGDRQALARYSLADARLTHTNRYVGELNQKFAVALGTTIAEGLDRVQALELLTLGFEREHIEDYSQSMGWVKLAFNNLCDMVDSSLTFEEALVATVGRGGDTDTNAAICGAFLGGVLGVEAIPQRWRDVVDNCRPGPGTLRPRPQEYWPTDLAGLADQLLAKQERHDQHGR